MQWHANWIRPAKSYGSVCPAFRKTFFCPENVVSAALRITAMGVYEASLNGSRVGDFILAPGWTVYQKRLQVQQYELRIRPGQENELTVLVGKGWYRGRLAGWLPGQNSSAALPAALTAELTLRYPDGHTDTICTDASWQTAESAVRDARRTARPAEKMKNSSKTSRFRARCSVSQSGGMWMAV